MKLCHRKAHKVRATGTSINYVRSYRPACTCMWCTDEMVVKAIESAQSALTKLRGRASGGGGLKAAMQSYTQVCKLYMHHDVTSS